MFYSHSKTTVGFLYSANEDEGNRMAMDIIRASSEDEERVFQFLCNYFYVDEPLNAALKRTAPRDKSDCISVDILKEGLSFLAVKQEDPTVICGVFLNREIQKDKKDDTWEHLKTKSKNTAYGKIMEFLNYTGSQFHKKLNICFEETNTSKAFDITVISVSTDYRRQKLGYRLMEKTIELAREKNYEWMTIECSSTFSAYLAKKFGFYVIYELPYEDWKDEEGNIVFQTSPPHFTFQALVKRL